MERDKIIKSMEICRDALTCKGCTYDPLVDCHRELWKDAISLIKELTEENERLRAAIPLWAKQCVELEERCMQLRADTVRKMQEALEHRIHSKLSYHGWYIKETVIPEIAKDMLEG